jgi:hypothetical protein
MRIMTDRFRDAKWPAGMTTMGAKRTFGVRKAHSGRHRHR